MFIAIGNCPSSGSTFLADIMDSVPFTICGSEIGIFATREYYTDFKVVRSWVSSLPTRVQKNHLVQRYQFFTSRCSSCYCGRIRLDLSRLYRYGLDVDLVKEFVEESSSFSDFCNQFFHHFSVLRNKHELAFYTEKTPQNIHTAKWFLEYFPESFFLHIVRNPIFVYKSLRKRGFPPYIAAATWLIDLSAAYKLRDHPRLYTIRYEDFVSNPFAVVCKFILDILGEKLSENKLKELYDNNHYRRLVSRKIKTWSISKYGKLGNANKNVSLNKEDGIMAKWMLRSNISDGYARSFGLPKTSYRELIDYYGYNLDDLVNLNTNSFFSIDSLSRRRLLRKWWQDFRYAQASVSDLVSYLNPITYE